MVDPCSLLGLLRLHLPFLTTIEATTPGVTIIRVTKGASGVVAVAAVLSTTVAIILALIPTSLR